MNWVWIWTHLGHIWDLMAAHIGLSAIPIVAGFILSVPLGYFASRSRIARSILLSVGSFFYTIPSLAFFLIVPVIIGTTLLFPGNVVIALSVYAIAIMIRSAADAFAAVSADVQDSATAVGFSAWQRFVVVDLPLAGPVLLAGLRVVSVSTVSLLTIGSAIGTSTLGNLFTEGFQLNFPTEIWVGIIGTLVVAAVFDLILVLLARLLLPWNRKRRVTVDRRSRVAVAAS